MQRRRWRGGSASGSGLKSSWPCSYVTTRPPPMKLMLRPLWPLSSFLGLLDLKTGVIVALLFAVGPSHSSSKPSLISPIKASQQGRRRLWLDCHVDRRWWILCTAQPLPILRHCPCRPRVGSARCQRGPFPQPHNLHQPLTLHSIRRTRGKPFTLLTYSSRIISSPPPGPYSSPSSGGCTPPMTAAGQQIPMPNEP